MTDGAKRIEQWKKKLLDMTVRNAFLNIKKALNIPLSLSSSDIGSISRTERSYVLFSAEEVSGSVDTANGRIGSNLNTAELANATKKLFRSYKSNIKETGNHTLYLAVGSLDWTRKNDKTVYHAPLVLVPADASRKGRSNYSFTFRFEDASYNTSLIQFLNNECGLEIADMPLSSPDEILSYIDNVKEAVSIMKDWTVSESCFIGIFSFANIAIWYDLSVRGADILQHKLVKAIISGCPWHEEDCRGDREVSCTYLPLPADSTQEAAVELALKGNSFVLTGPPGTGKSNTLCNLLASQIGNGKSALMTSEKAAALDVIYERLRKLGLADFCLFITPQTTSKQVLNQLERALNLQIHIKEDFPFSAYKEAEKSRKDWTEKANEYTRFLNKKHARFGGMSLYELFEEYEAVRNTPVGFSLYNITPEVRVMQEAAIRVLTEAGSLPFAGIRGTDFFNLNIAHCKEMLPKAVADYKRALEAFAAALNAFSTAIDVQPGTWEEIMDTMLLAKAISFLKDLPSEWLIHIDNNEYIAGLCETVKQFAEAEEVRRELETMWLPSFLDLDIDFVCSGYYSILRMPYIRRKFELFKLAADLCPYSLDKSVSVTDLGESLKLLKKYQTHRCIAQKLLETYSIDVTAGNYRELLEKIHSIHKYKELLGGKLFRLSVIDDDLIKDLTNKWKELVSKKQKLYTIWDVSEPKDRNVHWLDGQLRLCDILEDTDAVCKLIAAVQGIYRVSLGGLFDAYSSGELKKEELLCTYRKHLYREWIDSEYRSATFDPFMYNKALTHALENENSRRLAARTEVHNRVTERIAEFKAANPAEVALLKKAILKQGRGMSIHELFSMMPSLVQVLCPCIICSPAIAAKHLPAAMAFDTIVSDESSQLRTCRTVSAISRGKAAVICGDNKQLPPTSFFESYCDDDDLSLEETDMNNILEDFLVLAPDERRLKFHYRSCSELIGFANNSFYEGELISVPAASCKPVLSLIKVNGTYENQHNHDEAEAVVKEVMRRYEADDSRSIGVICMNVQQQGCIAEKLDSARENDPLFDKWLDEMSEVLFIKNLETVQGDERDIILISGGFGPDLYGEINQSMFGPLNHQDGWRRLNTAITRARKEMIVFSSISSDDINIRLSTSRGVRVYRDFLNYTSTRMLPSSDAVKGTLSSSNIRNSIYEKLTALGFTAVQNVGSGAFQVDVAVTHPMAGEGFAVAVLIGAREMDAADINTVTAMLVENGWACVKIITPATWYTDCSGELCRIIKPFGNRCCDIEKRLKLRFEEWKDACCASP